jgi:hypothetical protein
VLDSSTTNIAHQEINLSRFSDIALETGLSESEARKAMATEPLAVFRMDFADTLERHLRVLTYAFLAEKPE